ncbi:carbohydrate kinase family protein [Nocardiopsis tropica]|uniref:PfkB family carbohydrate kinase n=1 Tax=Nocardiopsis tropica TaxID=109330 RepID=A0ABU7L0W4_9ACTN|nr:PfkB family carbohydrate kinase [Nocardiopsis umidischolae]MEE2055175.1 PfkB family carbohydrate kinase [Nocardiopsis umidischolae]
MTAFHVVGGTYTDDVYWVGSELDFDVSLTASGHERTPGGPGACLALALRRLGADVELTTALGDQEDSARALSLLESEGVRVGPRRGTGPLDHTVTLVTPSLESVTVTRREQPPLEAVHDPAATPRPDTVLVVCSPSRLSTLAARARGRRLVLVPHLTQCRELAAMPSGRRADLLGAVDLLVANRREFDLLAPLPEISLVGAVAVTSGAGGSVLSTGDRRLRQPALSRGGTPRNPNGAGEAFTAALLVARASGADWEPSLRAAAIHAGRHVCRRASLSFPRSSPRELVASGLTPTETEPAYG